jgi:transcriptional regulator with XRE-family HTH domain
MAERVDRVGAEGTWPQDWGHLLRLARQVAGLSLTELSAQAGLSKGYLSKLESGHPSARNPSRATLAALARALPSFGPLAHTLEPTAPLGELALAQAAPALPEVIRQRDGTLGESPVQLGWRELELLVALLALEQAALPLPTNVVVLGRAAGRSAEEASRTLGRLVRMGVLEVVPARRPGMPPEYRPAAGFEAMTGLRRVGDALVLAASLLARSPALRRRSGGEGDED